MSNTDGMKLLETVKELTYSHGLTIAELERRLGFSNGSIRRWGSNIPSTVRLSKVANFFDVSPNYLLGLEQPLTIDKLVSRLKYNDKPITVHQKRVLTALISSYLETDNK